MSKKVEEVALQEVDKLRRQVQDGAKSGAYLCKYTIDIGLVIYDPSD